MGKAERVKGHAFERKLRQEFRELGYKDCETSRYANKKLDDAKVDLTDTGEWSVQAKAMGKQPSFRPILDSMPKDDNINLVFHKMPYKEDIVVMSKSDFYKIVQKINQPK